MKKYYIGIDIGGTKCAVLLSDKAAAENGDISTLVKDKIKFPTNVQLGYEQAISRIFEAIDEVISRNGINADEIISFGISCGGPLNSKTGIILSPPNLIGWDNVHIVDMLKERYGSKAILQNDANACGLAEWKFGAAKGYENVVFLTMGTGMGAGLILGGRLYDGASGMAGEVGHIRLSEHGPVGYGKAGSFEGFCSGSGIARIARTKITEQLQIGNHPVICPTEAELDNISAKTIAEAAKAGDALALSVYDECAEYLGRGLSVIIDILNPDVIVIGSVYQRSGELLEKKMNEVIKREAIQSAREVCRVVPAELGDSIGDIAALSVAMMED